MDCPCYSHINLERWIQYNTSNEILIESAEISLLVTEGIIDKGKKVLEDTIKKVKEFVRKLIELVKKVFNNKFKTIKDIVNNIKKKHLK